MAGSDVILRYIPEALICPDARVLWQERWKRFKSGETSGRFLVQSQNLFAPPPYYQVHEDSPSIEHRFENFSEVSTRPLQSDQSVT